MDNFKKKFRVLLEIVDEDFIKYIKDLVNKRKVRVIREIKENLVLLDYTYLFFGLVVDSVQEYEYVFMRFEYNSTLRMRKEIESIKESYVDVVKVLDKKLQILDTVFSDIREKVSLDRLFVYMYIIFSF